MQRKALLALFAAMLSFILLPSLAFGVDDADEFATSKLANPVVLELNDDALCDTSLESADDSFESGDGDNAGSDSLISTKPPKYAVKNAAEQARSGVASLNKPTLKELRQAWRALPSEPSRTQMFATAPDISSYKAGTYTENALSYAEKYLNLIRKQANLGPIAFDSKVNTNAAQGALILARNDDFTHYPKTPSGISDAAAAAGKYACQTSNLSGSWGSPYVIRSAIQGQMNDSGFSNIEVVGHRRWLLNPITSSMGIGSAFSSSGWSYTNIRVLNNPLSDYYNSDYGTIGQGNSVGVNLLRVRLPLSLPVSCGLP